MTQSGPSLPAGSQDVARCERHIAQILRRSPLVRLLRTALRRAGCPVTPHRHLTCDANCPAGLDGGYDVRTNQVVVCADRCRRPETVETILLHELVHMYDHCTARVDFNDPEHLACTEVRAANLMHCKRRERMLENRQACVKRRATASVVAVKKDLTHREASQIVDKVFNKCSADLEPVGRYTFSEHCERAALSDFVFHASLNRQASEKDLKSSGV